MFIGTRSLNLSITNNAPGKGAADIHCRAGDTLNRPRCSCSDVTFVTWLHPLQRKLKNLPHIRINRESKTFLRESVIPCWQIKAVSVSSCPSSLLPWSLSISPRGVNTHVSGFNWASTPNLTFMGITSANLHSKPGRYSSLSHYGQEKLSDLLTVPKPRLREGSLILSPGPFYSSTPLPPLCYPGPSWWETLTTSHSRSQGLGVGRGPSDLRPQGQTLWPLTSLLGHHSSQTI